MPFKCDVHRWMNAYVGVLDHPFYAVTGATARFELRACRPGTYTIEAWHEKLGTQTQTRDRSARRKPRTSPSRSRASWFARRPCCTCSPCSSRVSTAVLIFAGGLVTSTGSGLSVPDWPNTYGWFMFTFPLEKMVGGILLRAHATG